MYEIDPAVVDFILVRCVFCEPIVCSVFKLAWNDDNGKIRQTNKIENLFLGMNEPENVVGEICKLAQTTVRPSARRQPDCCCLFSIASIRSQLA